MATIKADVICSIRPIQSAVSNRITLHVDSSDSWCLGIYSQWIGRSWDDLLIPALSLLLSDPGIGEAQGPLGFLFQFASMLDEDVRLLAITATMFALVVAKAVIQTANGIFAAWIDGKASHDIRCDLSRRLLRVGYPFFLREDPAEAGHHHVD